MLTFFGWLYKVFAVTIIFFICVLTRGTLYIFYTAITRAKKRLKIYWSKAVEQKILDRIKPIDNYKDIALLKNEIKQS